MGSSDVSHRQHFGFPLSPPSSGTVTAVSSPRLPNIPTDELDAIHQHFAFPPTCQYSKTHLPPKKLQKPPVVPDVLESQDDSSLQFKSSPTRRSPARSMTLPSEPSPLSILTTAFPPATSQEADSVSSSSSSSVSSASSIHMRETGHTPGTGMGRKVAAKLQLFKESVGPTEDSLSAEPSRPQSSGSRRVGSSQIGDDGEIAEAQFEFVKRSEWPDREAAAIRRERSMTTLEHVKARDGIVGTWEGEQRDDGREGVLQEYNRWRRGFVESSEAKRGRRRDRAATETETKGEDHVLPKSSRGEPPVPRPSSHTFPPSPSLSRSPCRSPSSSQRTQQSDSSDSRPHPSRSAASSKPSKAFPSLSFVQPGFHHDTLSASISAPISPVEPTSPWSTDDDSNWETASVATTASTLSTNTRRYQGRRTRSPALLHNTSDATDTQSPPSSFVFRGSDTDHPLYFNLSQEHLPHIPLRPFRNQVGGHSSIYKFTKQAVCKVCIPFFLPMQLIKFYSRRSASCFTRKPIL
ncbi:hypothetical protein P691DRAFT_257815 [Macrolepiota fuliginosa MF-IS2]|uniref:Uncharacterized protein n=1 Tax=Macrolepiota fuliginosa MF-IS2 TaxID=1400762 RepID=A0A9P6C8E9_9AGAR|nr:hypothetical protein P691DRAFT_257815 [Macrolepiota fuliginosa MF-IS2]